MYSGAMEHLLRSEGSHTQERYPYYFGREKKLGHRRASGSARLGNVNHSPNRVSVRTVFRVNIHMPEAFLPPEDLGTKVVWRAMTPLQPDLTLTVKSRFAIIQAVVRGHCSFPYSESALKGLGLSRYARVRGMR